MTGVRELEIGATRLVARALLELRPHLKSLEAVTTRADEQRPAGYRLVGSFEAGDEEAAAVAGFRVGDSLAWGRHVYVDDLVTRPEHRGRGHARAVMEFIEEEARRAGCAAIHLDSGVGPDRRDAHTLYFALGMRISSHHFQREL